MNAVVEREGQPATESGAVASPLDLPAEQFREGLQRRKTNRSALMDWIREALVDGVDYGRIHSVGKGRCGYAKQGRAHECPIPEHWSKPTLRKPGAEKICGMLGVSVSFPTLQDYEQAALSGVALVHVIVRCELHDASGQVVADGIGARSIDQEGGDINKALKMAEKSAHIDATLRMAGLSEVFTQDLEDMPGFGQPASNSTSGAEGTGEKAAERIEADQLERLETRISELNLDRERVRSWVVRATRGRITALDQLTPTMYRKLDAKLDEWADQTAAEAAS